jgi:hypothetical protein
MAVNLDDVQPNVVTADPVSKIWLFYGDMGTRKTSVACAFPNHLLIAYDIGYKMISGANALPVQNWSDFKSAVKQLDLQKNKDRFKVVVIDTAGKAYQACYQYMCNQMGVSDPAEAGKYGIGWKKVRNEFETTIYSIAQKGYGVIMLAHSDEIEKEDPNTKQKYIQTKIDTDKRPEIIIKQMADFVFFLHKETRDGTENEPTVYAYSNLVQIDTKSRSRYFTPRFEFTYENLCNELEKAVEKQYEIENIARPQNYVETNPYVREQVSFETLKAKVIEAAQTLVSNPNSEADATALLTSMFKGTPVSQVVESPSMVEILQVAYTSLEEIKERYSV